MQGKIAKQTLLYLRIQCSQVRPAVFCLTSHITVMHNNAAMTCKQAPTTSAMLLDSAPSVCVAEEVGSVEGPMKTGNKGKNSIQAKDHDFPIFL